MILSKHQDQRFIMKFRTVLIAMIAVLALSACSQNRYNLDCQKNFCDKRWQTDHRADSKHVW